jgi:hypothetical protein
LVPCLVKLIFADPEIICGYERYQWDFSFPAGYADFRRQKWVHFFLRLSVLSAEDCLSADYDKSNRWIGFCLFFKLSSSKW